MIKTDSSLPKLPPNADLETHTILKMLIEAHRYLAKLKGTAYSIPNENILIQTLSLQEAKDSSEIENIVTTHDELFKADLQDKSANPSTKEVERYALALRTGFNKVQISKTITINQIIEIQSILEQNRCFTKRT
jgi:Fic family protein